MRLFVRFSEMEKQLLVVSLDRRVDRRRFIAEEIRYREDLSA